MEKVTIILNDGPASMRSWNGLRVAAGFIGVDMEVEVFLFDAAVYAAIKGQKPPEGLRELNLANKLTELMELGVKVNACGTCVEAGGLKKEELVDGVTVCTLTDLCKSVKAGKDVLVF